MVPPCSVSVSRAPTYSISLYSDFRVQDYHLLSLNFPVHSTNLESSLRASPLSLAATKGISVDFFSFGYLDVSVPRVRLPTAMYSLWDIQLMLDGFPHSEISGSKVICHLPEAYRRLSRLSSPLIA
jgi:hypothetical protein